MTDKPNPEQPDPDLTEEDLGLITGGAQEAPAGRFAPREVSGDESEAGRYSERDLGDAAE